MTNDCELIQYIEKELLINGTINSAKVRWGFDKTDMYKNIMTRTSYITHDAKITERLYHILHGIFETPICICGNRIKFNSITTGYRKTCNSHICMRTRTKWGTCSSTKISNNLKIMENFKTGFVEFDTPLERSDLNIFINERFTKTDYGRKNQLIPVNLYSTHQYILYSILYITQEMIPVNVLDIHKFEDFRFSERMYLIKEGLLEVPHCPFCNVQKRHFISVVNGYGRACDNSCWFNYNSRQIENCVKDIGFEILNTEFIQLKDSEFYIRCNTCGNVSKKSITNARWKTLYCSTCDGEVGVSREELQVRDFIQTLSKDIEVSKKILDHKEIDIYDPYNKLAVEYNGIYWHSTNDIDKIHKFRSKHLEKTTWATNNNIMLFHIFSSEWKNQQDIWKSILTNQYKRNNKIYARKCSIRAVDSELCEKFLDDNHLQGRDHSSVRLGLFYEDNLVSIMTFCKSRFNKKIEWELSRACSLKYTTVVGGASKLLNHFKTKYNPSSIITYANLRYSIGNIYKTLGFTKSHQSPPNYFYYRGLEVLQSRHKFQKHRLHKILDNFNPNISELSNMLNNGYRIIYDCGNDVYVWNKDLNKNPLRN